MFHVAVDTSRPDSPVTRTVETASTNETVNERQRVTGKDTVTLSTNERSGEPQANTTKSTSTYTGRTIVYDGNVYSLHPSSLMKGSGA